jgi:hypothetical protein
MNRLDHLKQTLPINIKENKEAVFTILDYNSKDGLEQWIKLNFAKEISIGRIDYYKESTAKDFYPAHSRNVCALAAKGDIICNVDADNIIGCDVDVFLKNSVVDNVLCASPWMLMNKYTSSHGRLAFTKKTFLRIGGYNEQFIYGYGGEDNDIFKRCKKLNFKILYFKKEDMNYIKHEDDERIKNISFTNLQDISNNYEKIINNRANFEKSTPLNNMEKGRMLHEGITDSNLQNNILISNIGKKWGSARIKNNFKTINYYSYCFESKLFKHNDLLHL